MTRHLPVLGALLLAMAACGGESAVRTQPADDVAGPVAPACPPEDAEGGAEIDWVPFVKVGERMYVAAGASASVTVAPELVGERVAQVQCRIGDLVGNPDFRARPGDAAYLPAGTELHAFAEADPTLRLAVHEDGAWRVYESRDVEGAERGSDVMDVSPGTVTRVELRDGDTATTVLSQVTDTEDLMDLTRAVLDAPVVQPDWDEMDDAPLFVRFVLRDGTFVERDWHVDSGYFASSLAAPEELKLLLDSAQPSSS